MASAAAGVLYLLSLGLLNRPEVSVTARGWAVWPAFTAFAAAFIVARVLLGKEADRRGGASVALVFAIIESAGQALLWVSSSSALGVVGCALTGFGYSLVYPAFGVEAVRRAPRESRGLAMGGYTAFLDLTLGIASPMLGLIAAVAGIGSVFLTSAVVVLCAAVVAIPLLVPISPARHAALLGGNLRPAAGSNTNPRHVDRGNCSALSALLDTRPRCHRENHHGTQT